MTAGSGRIDLNGRLLGEALYTHVAFDLDPIRMAVVCADDADGKHSPSAWKMSEAWESWSWDGCDGKETKVEVYSTGASVGLYLNGELLGKKKMPKNARTSFRVKYAPGELVAVSYDGDGKEIARTSLKSGGKETKLTLVPEKESVKKGGLCYVRLCYTDNEGVAKPLARGQIKVSVQGGELLALGHACPYNADGYMNDTTDTYFGEALAIVRADGSGSVKLSASSPYGDADVAVPLA